MGSIVDLKSPPLLKKGDYVYGSFVKAAHTSGFINDNNPGDRSDQIGRYPFSLQNTKEAILYAKEAQAKVELKHRSEKDGCCQPVPRTTGDAQQVISHHPDTRNGDSALGSLSKKLRWLINTWTS